MSFPSEYPVEDPSSKPLAGIFSSARVYRLKFVLSRLWWVVAVTVTLGLCIQGYRCSQQGLRYVSSSRMMVNGHVSVPQGDMYSEELQNFFGTQVALMKSADTLSHAATRVGAMHPEIPPDPTASVEAIQVPKTSIFDLYVTSANPEYAKALLEAVMDTYLAGKRGRKNQTTSETVSAITEEVSHIDSEIQKDDQDLLDFQKKNNVVFIEEQSASAGTYLVGLNNERAQLKKEYDLLTLESQDPNPQAGANASADAASSNASGSESASAARENIQKLKILRDEYSVYLKDQHPKMIALQEEIDKEEKFLGLSQNANREGLLLQIQNLEQQIADWNKKALDLSGSLGVYLELKSKRDREQTLYDQLTSSIQNVNLDKSIDQEDVIITEPASSASILPPEYFRQLIIGVVVGLLGGLAIIYFIVRLDNKIHSALEIEENFDCPLIGQVPRAILDRRSQRVPLLVGNDDRHLLLESHRNIRSSILFRSCESTKPKSFLVTSAIPGDGKSTLAANLAITFAHSGTRVLLIDADLRKGIQHQLFDVPLSPGLSGYLLEGSSWRKVVQRTNYPNVHLIPRGKVPGQAGDLLLSPAAELLLRESTAEYDMVLWDSAPLLAADDAANLCSKVGGVLFVVRIRHSSIQSVRAAMEELTDRNANIFGMILNGIESDQPGYADRYRYKEYYAATAET